MVRRMGAIAAAALSSTLQWRREASSCTREMLASVERRAPACIVSNVVKKMKMAKMFSYKYGDKSSVTK